jgi:hypothetical protein
MIELARGPQAYARFLADTGALPPDDEEKNLAKFDVENLWWEVAKGGRKTAPKEAKSATLWVWVSGTGPSSGPRRHIPQPDSIRGRRLGDRAWVDDEEFDNTVNAYLPRRLRTERR